MITRELKKRVSPSSRIIRLIQDKIIEALKENNSEYLDQYKSDSQKASPIITLWSYHHLKYFSRTGKQEWVKK